jgi:hypothetical protein
VVGIVRKYAKRCIRNFGKRGSMNRKKILSIAGARVVEGKLIYCNTTIYDGPREWHTLCRIEVGIYVEKLAA